MKVHMSLASTNIDKTTDFYTTLLGCEPVKRKRDYVKFDPQGIALNISFHQVKEVVYNSQHLGIQFDNREALNEVYARLLQKNLVSEARNTGVCCYARQDKFWVTDPDGYEWELYYLVEDTALKQDQITDCCGGETNSGEARKPAVNA